MTKEEMVELLKTDVPAWNKWRRENPDVEIDLSLVYLTYADLRYADLNDADLRYADLKEANLTGANLSNSNLRGASFGYVDLGGADLTNANLTGADLENSNLKGANIDYSCLPLWCGGLGWKIDKRIFAQLAYHLCSMVCDDEEVKEAQNYLLPIANQFLKSNPNLKRIEKITRGE